METIDKQLSPDTRTREERVAEQIVMPKAPLEPVPEDVPIEEKPQRPVVRQ